MEVIGNYKEFIIIEREIIKELETQANQLILDGKLGKGLGIMEAVEKIKENNIYNNKDFKIKS